MMIGRAFWLRRARRACNLRRVMIELTRRYSGNPQSRIQNPKSLRPPYQTPVTRKTVLC
jgi:hypothetical protein